MVLQTPWPFTCFKFQQRGFGAEQWALMPKNVFTRQVLGIFKNYTSVLNICGKTKLKISLLKYHIFFFAYGKLVYIDQDSKNVFCVIISIIKKLNRSNSLSFIIIKKDFFCSKHINNTLNKNIEGTKRFSFLIFLMDIDCYIFISHAR